MDDKSFAREALLSVPQQYQGQNFPLVAWPHNLMLPKLLHGSKKSSLARVRESTCLFSFLRSRYPSFQEQQSYRKEWGCTQDSCVGLQLACVGGKRLWKAVGQGQPVSFHRLRGELISSEQGL